MQWTQLDTTLVLKLPGDLADELPTPSRELGHGCRCIAALFEVPAQLARLQRSHSTLR